MNKREKLQLSNHVVGWLSGEIAQVNHIIKRLRETSHVKGYGVGGYCVDDLDHLENRLKELECRSGFESRNIKRIRYED